MIIGIFLIIVIVIVMWLSLSQVMIIGIFKGYRNGGFSDNDNHKQPWSSYI